MNIVTKALLITLAGIAFMKGAPARAQDSVPTCHGEAQVCEALIDPVITIKKVSDRHLRFVCGAEAQGCAQIYAGFETCTIYLKRGAGKKVKLHEENHCRGWAHIGHGHKAHDAEWVPFEAVEQWLLKQD